METPSIRHIREADAAVGCVAWLTNGKILREIASKNAASIIVQKEDFLKPDFGPLEISLAEVFDAFPTLPVYTMSNDGPIEIKRTSLPV